VGIRRDSARSERSERGSVMATAIVILLAISGVAALTVGAVSRGVATAGHQITDVQALHAAQSGVSAAAAFLRHHIAQGGNWSAYVSPSNGSPVSPEQILGNGVPASDPTAPLHASNSWYEVTLLNNTDDTGFAAGVDADAVIVIRSIGHGPDGARVVLEVEVVGTGVAPADSVCAGYAQENMSELGAGRNDCLGEVKSGAVTEFSPGGT
jgi:hypothetical protein